MSGRAWNSRATTPCAPTHSTATFKTQTGGSEENSLPCPNLTAFLGPQSTTGGLCECTEVIRAGTIGCEAGMTTITSALLILGLASTAPAATLSTSGTGQSDHRMEATRRFSIRLFAGSFTVVSTTQPASELPRGAYLVTGDLRPSICMTPCFRPAVDHSRLRIG
jgi:hypothetical protein